MMGGPGIQGRPFFLVRQHPFVGGFFSSSFCLLPPPSSLLPPPGVAVDAVSFLYGDVPFLLLLALRTGEMARTS